MNSTNRDLGRSSNNERELSIILLATRYLKIKKAIRDRLLATMRSCAVIHENLIEDILKLIIDLGRYDSTELSVAIRKARSDFKSLENKKVKLLSVLSPDYPSRFTKLPDAPFIIGAKGNTAVLNNKRLLAVLGRENCTQSVFNIGLEYSDRLTKRGVTIVSGLGKGCDTAFNMGSLSSQNRLIAISEYPLEKIPSYEASVLAYEIIANNGCLISENLFNDDISHSAMIRRGRLVAALSDAIFILQAENDNSHFKTVIDALHTIRPSRPVCCFSPDYQDVDYDKIDFAVNESLIMNENLTAIRSYKDLELFLQSVGLMAEPYNVIPFKETNRVTDIFLSKTA